MIKVLKALKEQLDEVKVNFSLTYEEFVMFSQLYASILQKIEFLEAKDGKKEN